MKYFQVKQVVLRSNCWTEEVNRIGPRARWFDGLRDSHLRTKYNLLDTEALLVCEHNEGASNCNLPDYDRLFGNQ